jgi:hypothetical protein
MPDAVEEQLQALKDKCGPDLVETALSSLGILEEELLDREKDEFAEFFPGLSADILDKKFAVHNQKRMNLLTEVKQRIAYLKPTDEKLFLTVPCGETQPWHEFRKTLGSVQLENKDNPFYAAQSGRNKEAMQKFQEGAKRKFKNFVGELQEDKKRSDAGAAKTLASKQRLENFRKEQNAFYAERSKAFQGRMEKIEKAIRKDQERQKELAEESDVKIAEKYARSDKKKEEVLAKMQHQSDVRSGKMQVVQDRIQQQQKDFLRWATKTSRENEERQRAYLDGKADDAKNFAQDAQLRADNLKKFVQRKRDYEAKVQSRKEAQFLENKERFDKSRNEGAGQRLLRSQTMHDMLTQGEARWTKEKKRQDELYKTFTDGVNDMHARQADQVAKARQWTFVDGVEDKRARKNIWLDAQISNMDRNQRSQESFTNSNLVRCTIRNKGLNELQVQREKLQKERLRMFMEIGVKADEAKEVFYRIKGESDPAKINKLLGKLDLGLPDVNLEEVGSPKGGDGDGGGGAKKNPF